MASFTNYATLRYGGVTVTSNTVTGTLPDVLVLTKTPVNGVYVPGGTVTYLLSLVNPGETELTGLTLTDDLGGYVFGEETLYPLAYMPDSLQMLVNGLPQAAPAAAPGPPLVISGITVPAGGTVILAYEARTTDFAPLAQGREIINTAEVGGLPVPVTASASVTPEEAADLRITKDLAMEEARLPGEITYTFTIENLGSVPAAAAEAVVLEDLFRPALSGLRASRDGVPWTQGTDYTYNEATGLFASLPGAITVPAAEYAQDENGVWTITPGQTVVTVTGNI
ncbi:MAG: hypothetical protein IKG89_06965 [Oscillospiraceae bacterium]|nr:hypothetical protein [Oscillospiraceae bacterium]